MQTAPQLESLRILVIDDNPDILANIYGYLEPLGYVLDSARDGLAALAVAADRQHDAIVLDIMLPGIDGLELCRKLREDVGSDVPVLMLTARDTLDDRILGLRSGADDYLVKPFALSELEARLQALVRRSKGRVANRRLRVGRLELDQATHEVTREGKRVDLTPIGFRILNMLVRASPAVVTRSQLEHELWGDKRPGPDVLRIHIHGIRQALDKPFAHAMLVTVPSVGYRLIDPDVR